MTIRLPKALLIALLALVCLAGGAVAGYFYGDSDDASTSRASASEPSGADRRLAALHDRRTVEMLQHACALLERVHDKGHQDVGRQAEC